MSEDLDGDFQYYLDNQDKLVEKYNGKIIVIRNMDVIGTFDDEAEAIEETSKLYPLGTFLVQKCEPGSDSYTHTYHSRVVFAQ